MSEEESKNFAREISIGGKNYLIYDIKAAARDSGFEIEKLPYSLRVLFENTLRRSQGKNKTGKFFADFLKNKTSAQEVDFYPARVLMQDFTGVPAVVDLASMRDAMKTLGDSPHKVNPMIQVDLVIDHSVQVDSYGKASSFAENVKNEMERNEERYRFLKWGQKNFNNFSVVPPGTGICHQVNLEYLAQSVWVGKENHQDPSAREILYPDTVVGTDSHTTMVNALAVLGWGVGGIEAEAAMLGQPLPMQIPEVVGVKLFGDVKEGVTATDLVLTVTEILRKKGVVGKFVEFFGPGLDKLGVADRSTVANMAPEYGATCGFFPVDAETVKYLTFTGRDAHRIKIVEEYSKEQGLWRTADEPEYSSVVEMDLALIEPSLAGPTRPQDRLKLADIKTNFAKALPSLNKGEAAITEKFAVTSGEGEYRIGHGNVVIAAITSCTNTSNPSVMIGAGLVARKAAAAGLKVKPWVKTSLAPGSQVVTEYLHASGLNRYLDRLGFNLVGYGCTTCIGNSGPLDPKIDKVIADNKLAVAAVLSGNRNFEGRIHPAVRANYLASPPLVVAFALAGTVNIDFNKEPLGIGDKGVNIYLKDIWPTREEIEEHVRKFVTPEMFKAKYADVFKGEAFWQNLAVTESDTYKWNSDSTYIKNPPYFADIGAKIKNLDNVKNARILALFGDSITTDHISPAGNISKTSPAAKYLMDRGVAPADFNSYGSRRGNHEIMMRGTFANIRIKNEICSGVEGGVTINHLTGERISIYDAAMAYQEKKLPLVVFAGKEYGTGSSRDWAAKGTSLLGVKAVIAESFERIHRSNLVGMGVLPLVFKDDKINRKNLNLSGDEEVSIIGITDNIKPYHPLQCQIKNKKGAVQTVEVILQVYTDIEVEYLKHGSILGAVAMNLRGA